MPKRSRKKKQDGRPADVNANAFQMIQEHIERSEADGLEDSPEPSKDEISRVMKALGSKGGKIGGKKRMAALSEEERTALALKAAKARWAKEKGKKPS